MKPPQPITLNHTFTTGHRLTIRVTSPLQSDRFEWTPCKPPPHVFQSEYQEFIRAVLPSAANHFKEEIPWFIPGDIGEIVVFKPETSTSTHND